MIFITIDMRFFEAVRGVRVVSDCSVGGVNGVVLFC